MVESLKLSTVTGIVLVKPFFVLTTIEVFPTSFATQFPLPSTEIIDGLLLIKVNSLTFVFAGIKLTAIAPFFPTSVLISFGTTKISVGRTSLSFSTVLWFKLFVPVNPK